MIEEKNILALSFKDYFSPKMLQYSVLPFIVTIALMYLLFFWFAGMGLEQLGSMSVESTQTTMQNGIPHTESFSAQIEGLAIIQFLMSYTITSWIASFLVYAIGGFFVLYISIFVAIIVVGFLTPYVLKEVQKRHYRDVEIVGHSNIAEALFLTIKWALTMLLLFFLLIPFYFIPLVNIIAFNLPLYYFFHKMMTYDVASTICSKEERKEIDYFAKNRIRVKTLALYLVSLIPFAVFFAAVFYVIYLGHTYFVEVRKVRH